MCLIGVRLAATGSGLRSGAGVRATTTCGPHDGSPSSWNARSAITMTAKTTLAAVMTRPPQGRRVHVKPA